MLIYGSTTSPFVRRVRIVSDELGIPSTLTIAGTPETDPVLRRVTPLWKIPVAEIAGKTIFDSHAIIDTLLATHPHPSIALPPKDSAHHARNLGVVIDGALESAIFVFYLKRDGAAVDEIPYGKKQIARVESAITWVETELDADSRLGGQGDTLTLEEIALVTTLDWMDFRAAYPTSKHPRFAGLRERCAGRSSFVKTAPGV